jgi:tRNA dimethylallyltransferase
MPPTPAAFADALVLTGATGSGKSAVALELAAELGGEIVAMDSMTLYRGMDIGTAKPTAAERDRVPHHLIDVLEPWESGSVAWWLDRAAAACADIRGRGKTPIFVGGTPFYLKALLHGLFEAPPVDPAIRAKWEAEAARIGNAALHERLVAVDPKAASKLHPNDVRRVVRALEVFDATGVPLSTLQTSWAEAPAPLPCVVLDWPREELYRRIDARVLAMLGGGWLEEVGRLLALPRPLSGEARQALGYPEVFAHLAGGPSWAETVTAIQTRTRQFAKRQRTWFRALPTAAWVPASEPRLQARVREAWAKVSASEVHTSKNHEEIASAVNPRNGRVL